MELNLNPKIFLKLFKWGFRYFSLHCTMDSRLIDKHAVYPTSNDFPCEQEFTDTPKDNVEVVSEDVFEHLEERRPPEGLIEVDGGLKSAATAADNDDEIGETVLLSTELELGHGKHIKRARSSIFKI